MIEVYSSIEEAIKENPNSYVSHSQIADCMICSELKDLRCGACFNCSEKVLGKPIKNADGKTIGHRLWEKGNESNSWITGI